MRRLWKVLGGEFLIFYIMTASSGHQEHRGCMWLPLIWASVEISGHKEILLFWSRHLLMMPETEMLRLEYQRITNQTKQAAQPTLDRTTIFTGHKSQGIIWKYASWNSFLSTNMERSPAEIMLFFGHLTKKTWSMSKRQRDTEKSR